MAEEEGFEPSNGLLRCWFSRPVPSTTRPLFPGLTISLSLPEQQLRAAIKQLHHLHNVPLATKRTENPQDRRLHRSVRKPYPALTALHRAVSHRFAAETTASRPRNNARHVSGYNQPCPRHARASDRRKALSHSPQGRRVVRAGHPARRVAAPPRFDGVLGSSSSKLLGAVCQLRISGVRHSGLNIRRPDFSRASDVHLGFSLAIS